MKDIRHDPVGNDDLTTFTCSRCGGEIPQPVAVMAPGEEVVEIGGGVGFVPFDGTPGSIPCSGAAVESERAQAQAISESAEDGDTGRTPTFSAEAPELSPGESVKQARPLTDMERMVGRTGYANFLAMREATRPKEKQSD